MSPSAWRVRVVREPNDVLRLIATDLDHSPVQRAAWLEAWFDCFAASRPGDVCAAAVEETATGRPVLVLPLVREERRGVVRMTAWDGGVTDYNAPLVAPDFAPTIAEMRALWAELMAALPPCDVVEIDKMPARVGGRSNPLAMLDGVRPSKFSGFPLPLEGGFSAVLETRFDQSHRRSLAKKRKKLMNKGALVFDLLGGEEGAETLGQVLAWRRERFAGSDRVDAAATAARFYRRLSADGGPARIGRLTLDGVTIAGCFGTLTGSTFQLLAVAHDRRWNNWSPGLLAIESAIEAAIAAGAEVFDFTIGDEPYKLDFGVVEVPLSDLVAVRSLKGRAAVVLANLRRWASRQRAWLRARLKRRAEA